MVSRLFKDRAFESDQCQAMGIAFDGILQELRLKDRDDPLCEMIAKTIIELGQQGVREPSQLQERALKILRQSDAPTLSPPLQPSIAVAQPMQQQQQRHDEREG